MRLARYLARIGFDGDPAPTRDTLTQLLRAHVLTVPFENLDVQLGVPTSTDVRAAYDKIVERGRGGWCYEQNGLFGWALGEIGFDVTRIAAAVMRHERDASADDSHLCLLVRVPAQSGQVLLADVGFGGSLLAPLPFEDGIVRHEPFAVGLRHLDDGRWRFFQDSGSGEFSFDFEAAAADEARLAAKCTDLQTNPESNFVLNLVAQRRRADAHVTLRGRVLTTLAAAGRDERLIETPEQLVETLAGEFALDLPAAAALWPRVVARHEAVFGNG